MKLTYIDLRTADKLSRLQSPTYLIKHFKNASQLKAFLKNKNVIAVKLKRGA